MSDKNREKKKAKRKIKQKEYRKRSADLYLRDKFDFLYAEARWHYEEGNHEKELYCLEKLLKLDPKNEEIIRLMGYVAFLLKKPDLERDRLLDLFHYRYIKHDEIPLLLRILENEGNYQQAFVIASEVLKNIKNYHLSRKRNLKEFLIGKQIFYQSHLESPEQQSRGTDTVKTDQRKKTKSEPIKNLGTLKEDKPKKILEKKTYSKIPIQIEISSEELQKILSKQNLASLKQYHLAIKGHEMRFKETFESLISLNSLKNIRSFWFQEETARKILKTFRGRALLADEVGLGKTIEALMVLKEYIQRGMVKSALILTPSPLVSQWDEELRSKFELDFHTSSDAGFQTKNKAFWGKDFILASINIAKSKKNYPMVVQREYDMVIVDEAHHLKNRNTMNWKLVNALKKRFLLLITATPVENNLMELYNIITLLKPGQLKTASAFRKEFMNRKDPTDPRNRQYLKELLGQVMIRNTRAFAKIDIPPRFAQTIHIKATPSEIALYRELTELAKEMSRHHGSRNRLMLKNLLAEAGSSPKALEKTLSRILEREDIAAAHKKKIQELCILCNSMQLTSKEKMIRKLLQSQKGKIIIFVKYHGTLEHISNFLTAEGISHALFHGKMELSSKDEQIQSFRDYKDVLVTTEVGGEGRNLQFCHRMINYDLPWNPMKIEQRIGRIHRIGQENEVLVYNLCAEGSLEEYILEMLDKKINMFEMVIGEIDMILGRLEEEKDFSEIIYDIWMDSDSEEETKKGFEKLGSKLKKVKNSYKKSKELDEKLFGENYEI